jgi:TolB protein
MDFAAEFSPCGEELLFQSERKGNADIFLLHLKSGKTTQLTTDTSPEFVPRFSPDGKKITYTMQRRLSEPRKSTYLDFRMIYVMNRDGSNQTRLTSESGFSESSVFSPDGKKIIFESRQDNQSTIYVMNCDGTGQKRLIDSKNSNYPSDWRWLDARETPAG